MTTHSTCASHPWRHYLAYGLLMVLLASCDTVSNDEAIFLTAPVEDLRFSFEGNDLETGRPADLVANRRIDLSGFLRDRGFNKSDVVSARVESVRLEVLFPLSETANFLESAILKLEADGISALEVANQTDFPNDDQAAMNVIPNRDITSLVQADDFGVILQIVPERLEANRDYDLGMEMQIRIEVAGL